MSESQPEAPASGQVTRVSIDANAYQLAVKILQGLPFEQVSGVLQALNQSAIPIYAQPGQVANPGQGGAE